MLDEKYSLRWAFTALTMILGTALVAWWLSQPPAPLPGNAPELEFSAIRAMEHIEVMAQEPHPAGSTANDEVCAYIQEQLIALGVEMEVIDAPYHQGSNHVEWPRAVLGRIRGTDTTKAFAVDAHFDSTPYGPGAADIITGVAAMLETARILKLGPPLRNDVIFVFTDQEEVGANGARAFTRHPWFEDVGVMLGLEARGVRGPSLMFETSDQNGWLIRELQRSGVSARANSTMFSVYDRLPFGSDFSTYKHHVPGYNVAFVDGFGYYHTRLDRPDKVSLASIQHHGNYTLGLARHLGNIPLEECRAPNATYFNLLGPWLIVYPQHLDIPLTLLALTLFALGLFFGLTRGAIRITGLAAGLMTIVVVLLLAVITALPGIMALVLYREALLYQNTLYCIGMAVLNIAGCLLVFGLVRRRLRGVELLAAALFFWAALLYPLHRYLAGGTHIIIWPMLFGATTLIVLALTHREDQETPPPRRVALLTLWMVPVIAALTPLLIMVAHTLTPLSAFLINPLTALVLGLLAPQVYLITQLGRWRLAAGAAALGFALFGWGLVANQPGPDTPKLNSLSYAAHFDTGEAWWISADRTTREWVHDLSGYTLPAFLFAKESPTDSWTEQFFPAGTTRGAVPEFRGGDQKEYLKAPAPAPNFEPLSMTVLKDEIADGRRTVTMQVHSPKRAARIRITKRFDGAVYAATLDGLELEPSDNDWYLNLSFMPASGATLTLEIAPGYPLAFFVREESWALPVYTQYTPRPDTMAAEPNRVLDFHSRLHSEHTYTLATVEPTHLHDSAVPDNHG